MISHGTYIFFYIYSETVYVGESKDQKFDTFYAIPSYIDDFTPTIKKNRINLLEGPKGKTSRNDDQIIPTGAENDEQTKDKKHKNIIFFGHYEVPSTETFFETISSTKSKDANNELSIIKHQPFVNLYAKSNSDEESKIILNDSSNVPINDTDTDSAIEAHDVKKIGTLKYIKNYLKAWMDEEENKILKLLMVILIGIVITMFWYFHTTVKEVIYFPLLVWKIAASSLFFFFFFFINSCDNSLKMVQTQCFGARAIQILVITVNLTMVLVSFNALFIEIFSSKWVLTVTITCT